MNTMVRPLSANALLVVVLLHFHGSTTFEDIHTCQVISTQSNSSRAHQHRKLIKFDFVRLSPTNDTISVPDSSPARHKSENNMTDNQVITLEQSTAFPGESSINCMCEVDSKTTTTKIRALQVMSATQNQPLQLQVHEPRVNDTKNFTMNSNWHHSFNDTSVVLFVASSDSKQFYSLVLEVTGNLTRVTCTQSAAVVTIGKEGLVKGGHIDKVITANTELIFEMPLLVIGGVLAVVGFLSITAGIAVWRRYRKERTKQLKKHEEHELKQFPSSNYFEISKEDSEHSSTESNTEIQDSSRKASMSFTSKKKHKQENKSSSGKQFLAVGDRPGTNEGDQKPSPGTMRYQRSLGRRNKKQKQKMIKENENNSKNVAIDEDMTYSSVEQEYEDVVEEKPAVAKRDIRVATPLAQMHCSGLPPSFSLRKTGNLISALTKDRLMPDLEPSVEEDTYSHLNRSNKSNSCHINHAATYDGANIYSLAEDTVRCKSTYADKKNSNGFKFSKQMSHEPKVETAKAAKDDERRTSVSSNQDDQDHIYEAVEKVETHSVCSRQSSQGGQYLTEELKKGKANYPVEDIVKREEGGNQETITDIGESECVVNTGLYEATNTKSVFLYDLAGPLDTSATTNDEVDIINSQSAEDACAVDNTQVSSALGEGRRLSDGNNILTKSLSIDIHNATDFQKKANGVERDLMNQTQSLAITDCDDLYNASDPILSDHTPEGSASSGSDTNDDEED